MSDSNSTPPAILRFRFFCLLLCLLYFLVAGAGVGLFFIPEGLMEVNKLTLRLLGGLFLFVGGLFFSLSFIGLHMPRRPGAWTYNRFLLFLGISSILLMPFSLILLNAWVKPEILEWYGINPS